MFVLIMFSQNLYPENTMNIHIIQQQIIIIK